MRPGVEVGLAPNIMKGINIFTPNVIKDFPYKYDKIIQVLWKKRNKEKKIFSLKVFEMISHGTLKFQIVFWALRPTSTNKGQGPKSRQASSPSMHVYQKHCYLMDPPIWAGSNDSSFIGDKYG
jgi:hypothetical protein